MKLYRWICWLREGWYILSGHLTTGGHDFRVDMPDDIGPAVLDSETGHFQATVQLLKCDDCGTLSVGWRAMPRV